jgi:hypothetical protein
LKHNKLIVFGIVIGFILSFMTVSASASTSQVPGTPQAGDTLIYEVTTWQFPDILDIETGGAVTSNINLVGSQVGLKILRADADSYDMEYM